MVAEARRGVRGRFLFTWFALNTRTTYSCLTGLTAVGQPSGAESLSVVRGGSRGLEIEGFFLVKSSLGRTCFAGDGPPR